MLAFKLFLENQQLPMLSSWVQSYFATGMKPFTLATYADYLEENAPNEQKAIEFFRTVANVKWGSVKLKNSGAWNGKLVYLFHDVLGWPGPHFTLNDRLAGSWFISPGYSTTLRHIVFPEETSYRLSLTNGKWFAHTNNEIGRVSVVSTRHNATPESERWQPNRRITLRDYKPLPVEQVPEEVLFFAFYKIMEKQIRGGH